VRVRVLELKEVKVPLLRIEVEAVETVIVSPECNLRNRAVAIKAKLLLKVEEAEVVIANPAAGHSEIGERLVDFAIRNIHFLMGTSELFPTGEEEFVGSAVSSVFARYAGEMTVRLGWN
jgi:hypothetical protein